MTEPFKKSDQALSQVSKIKMPSEIPMYLFSLFFPNFAKKNSFIPWKQYLDIELVSKTTESL